MSSDTYFVDAHSPEWEDTALQMTGEYFSWMNDQIQEACGFSIPDIVGMPLEQYIPLAMGFINPRDSLNAAFYLLISNGIPVGMGGLRQLPSGNGEIVRVYTRPEYRGQGYGKKILEHLIEDSKKRGFKFLNLDTGVFMKSAQSMYLAHGFTPCEPYEGAEPPPQLFPYWLYMQLEL